MTLSILSILFVVLLIIVIDDRIKRSEVKQAKEMVALLKLNGDAKEKLINKTYNK